MYTATSKQILAPVADAISQLIVINMDAEANNSAMPDLTEVAGVVRAQAVNLVGVGESMIASGDLELKSEMPHACAQVTAAANLLVTAAQELKAAPRSKEGRLKLIDASKGILQGTARLLDVFDDSEVRAIVATCKNCVELVNGVRQLGDDVPKMIEHMRPTCQILVDLTQQANKRVDELLYAPLQDRLRDSIDSITRTSTLMMSSTKSVAANPQNAAARQGLEYCCDRIVETIIDIEAVVQIREWSEPAYSELIGALSEHRSDAHKHLISIMSSVQQGDKEGLAASLSTSKTTALLLKQAQDILTSTQQEASKEELSQLIAKIRDVEKKITEVSTKAVSDHFKTALQRELYTLLTAAGDQFRDLEGLTDHIVAADIREAISQTRDHKKENSAVSKFYNASKTGDQSEFAPAAEALQKEGARLTSVLDHAAMLSKNPEVFRHIRSGQADISKLLKQVIASGAAVASNPKDKYLNEHLDQVINLWEDRLKKIEDVVIGEENIFQTNDILAADAVASETRFKKLMNAAVGTNPASYSALIGGIMDSIQRAVDTTKKEHEQSEDPEYRKKLRSAMEALQKAQVLGRDISPKFLASPNERPSADTLKNFQTVVMAAIYGAEDTIAERRTKSNRSMLTSIPEVITEEEEAEQEAKKIIKLKLSTEKLATSEAPESASSIVTDANGEEVEIINEYAPEPLPAEEAKQNPIKAAAQDLKVAASKWSANPMVLMSSTLAEKMSQISVLYRENTPQAKKLMIQLSKEIQDDCKFLVAEGMRVADACKDKVLKLQVMQALESIPTITMQLKIVAAVKAAEPKDLDSEKQLIILSQNLMKSIQTSLKATEVASIRVMRTAGNAAVAVVKFRKLLYAKKNPAKKAVGVSTLANVLSKPATLGNATTAPVPGISAAARLARGAAK